jgi:hypothetical protein
VEVGFDADNNGELDVNEVSKDENEDPLAITVYVVKADLEINGQRRWTPKFGQCNKL